MEETMYDNIPFILPLHALTGKYPVFSVAFKYAFELLEYRYLCKTDDGFVVGLRTESDAKMAAKNNKWAYIGKA